MNLITAKQHLSEACQSLDKQENDSQSQGNSVGAMNVCYWGKIVTLLEQGVAIPSATTKQILETPIDMIKQGYVCCCDHSNPSGYQSLIRLDFVGLSAKEIEEKLWVERSRQYFRKDPHNTVNSLRHMATPYDAWLKRGDDYLTAFMRANLTIAERLPELKKVALLQINKKRCQII